MINVLLVYRELIPSVRLCAYEQLKCLNDKGEIKFRPCQIGKLNKDLINLSDIVIHIRADSHFESKLSFYQILLGVFFFVTSQSGISGTTLAIDMGGSTCTLLVYPFVS